MTRIGRILFLIGVGALVFWASPPQDVRALNCDQAWDNWKHDITLWPDEHAHYAGTTSLPDDVEEWDPDHFDVTDSHTEHAWEEGNYAHEVEPHASNMCYEYE